MRMPSSCNAAIALLILFGASARAADPHPCTSVRDDRERLACYDRTFGTPAAPKPLPDPPPVRLIDQLPDKFSAKVSKIEWHRGVFVATLDNGQVWLQSERDSRVQIRAEETVTIRRASLGSFMLSGDQGIPARVRRLK